MEDQGVQSRQTFLVMRLFFLQPLQKHEDRSAVLVSFDDRSQI